MYWLYLIVPFVVAHHHRDHHHRKHKSCRCKKPSSITTVIPTVTTTEVPIVETSITVPVTTSEAGLQLVPPIATSAPIASPSGISASTLSQHSSLTDCWVVYQGNVYDLTSWIPNHPGGETIYATDNVCGTTNFQAAFTSQHGTTEVSKFFQVTTLEGGYSG